MFYLCATWSFASGTGCILITVQCVNPRYYYYFCDVTVSNTIAGIVRPAEFYHYFYYFLYHISITAWYTYIYTNSTVGGRRKNKTNSRFVLFIYIFFFENFDNLYFLFESSLVYDIIVICRSRFMPVLCFRRQWTNGLFSYITDVRIAKFNILL